MFYGGIERFSVILYKTNNSVNRRSRSFLLSLLLVLLLYLGRQTLSYPQGFTVR